MHLFWFFWTWIPGKWHQFVPVVPNKWWIQNWHSTHKQFPRIPLGVVMNERIPRCEDAAAGYAVLCGSDVGGQQRDARPVWERALKLYGGQQGELVHPRGRVHDLPDAHFFYQRHRRVTEENVEAGKHPESTCERCGERDILALRWSVKRRLEVQVLLVVSGHDDALIAEHHVSVELVLTVCRTARVCGSVTALTGRHVSHQEETGFLWAIQLRLWRTWKYILL